VNSAKWKWLLAACRLILGGVFIYASIDKIIHPGAFADILYNYNLIPGWMIHPLAVWLPWLELVSGIMMITGIFLRGATVILSGLLMVFIVALSINALRGYNIDCGCFATSSGEHQGDMIGLILRDIALLVPAGIILAWEWLVLGVKRK